MNGWSLPVILNKLHTGIEQRLESVRETLAHPVMKGNASENIWRTLLEEYLPKRYQIATAQVVDSLGFFSEQIDIVVFDRQYTPFIFTPEKQTIIPAESVYAVFESKQTINAKEISYAQEKVASVRKLHRTSLPIPHAGGTYPPKPLSPIMGGFLALESNWHPPLGNALLKALNIIDVNKRLDLGCIASHGIFECGEDGDYQIHTNGKAATAFLFKLISKLQNMATVPMIDVNAYAQHLGY
jgi:hypothetical protein